MASLKERIEQYVGTTGDDTALSNWLTQGAKFHLRLVPDQELIKYATEETVDSDGLDISDMIVLSVDKEGAPSTEYPSRFKARLTDSDSIHKATEFSPAHIIRAGKLYVYPDGGTAEAVTLPEVTFSDSEISELPTDLESATVLYAAIQEFVAKMQEQADNISISVDLPSISSKISYPSAPELTDLDLSTLSLPTEYTKPTVSLTETPTISDIDLSSITVPSAPTAPSFTYTDATASSVTSTSIAALPTAPSFSSPSKPTDLSDDYSEFDTRQADDDVEMAANVIQKIQSELQEYQADLQDAVESFNADIAEYQSEVQERFNQAEITKQEALTDAQLSNEVEVANAARKLEEQVSEYQAELQKYQADLNEYQAEVSATVQEFQINNEKDIQLWAQENEQQLGQYASDIQNELNRYQSEAQDFQLELEQAVQEYAQNLEKNISEWRIGIESASQENQAIIARYGQEVQAKMQEVGYELQAVSTKTQTYQAQIEQLRGEYQRLLTPYLQNDTAGAA